MMNKYIDPGDIQFQNSEPMMKRLKEYEDKMNIIYSKVILQFKIKV
jgi:hypothetical protein